MSTVVETQTNLRELAEFVVARARLSGASDATRRARSSL